MIKKLSCFFVLAFLSISPLWAQSKLQEAAPLVIPRSTTSPIPIRSMIDWEKEQVIIETTAPQKTATALQAMKLSFLVLMQSLRVDPHTVAGTLIEQDPALKDDFESVFNQGQLEEFSPKRVRMVIPLYSEVGLAKSIFYKVFEHSDINKATISKNIAVTEASYTGLIIDARNTKMFPCLVPQLRADKSREVIYSSQTVDFMFAMCYGMGGYASSISKAKHDPRVGNNPLILKAVSSEGPFRSTINLDDADIRVLKQANIPLKFLEKAKVVFVL